MTDNTQAELDELIEQRIKIASTQQTSPDEDVQIAWLADGIDLWHRSNGKMGHSPAKARRYIISSISRLLDSYANKRIAKAVSADEFLNYLFRNGYVDREWDAEELEGTLNKLKED